ncbi:MAG: SIS domain-containing protein, partial [Pseudomonadota bacterium]
MADDLTTLDLDVHFPQQMYSSGKAFAKDYYAALAKAAERIDFDVIGELAEDLNAVIHADKGIFICGNGGSAAVANHTLCDMIKCVSTDTKLTPRMHSLSVNTELLSALANDIGYDEVFSYQLDMFAREGDLLIT